MAEPNQTPMPKVKASAADASRPRARKWRRVRLITIVGVVAALLLGTTGIGVVYGATRIPDPNEEFQANTSFVYFRDGETRMGNFSVQNRQSIEFEAMPDSIKEAVVAAENRNFWTDRGISVSGMFRAALAIAGGGEMQGGSTITQQYVKILYLNSERTLDRKVRELFLAVKLGREVPKEEILEGYLNTVYFGRGAYGVQAASKAFFLTEAKDLTVPQAALLATMLPNPSLYDPSNPDNHQRILDRYRYVIAGMGETGKLTPEEVAEYSKELPELPEVPFNERYAGPQGHLMKMVEDELAANGMSQEQISGGGLKIVTTFDESAQDAAVETAQKYTKIGESNAGKNRKDDLHIAIASVDNSTGEVLALYGGEDYLKDNRNWATTPRQTASAFKPFALAAGLRDGYSLQDTFQGNTFTPKGDSVPSRNEFFHQYGPVTLQTAMAKSINTAFVDLTVKMKNGAEKIAQAAEDAGLPRGAGWDTNSSRIALGIPEASSLDMAGAYGTFANDGRAVKPHVIKEVFDAEGKSIYKADTQGKQVFDQGVARDVTYSLTSVVEDGTGSRVAGLGRPVAAKTGTAGLDGGIISAWFVGYTKQISTSVMFVSGDQGMGNLEAFKRSGDSTFFGGTYPAMTWNDYMKQATKGQKVAGFGGPAYVNGGKPKAQPQPTRVARPTTEAPATTVPPTTQAPETTAPPTTEAPETQAPETQAPETQAPETEAPATQAQTEPTQEAPAAPSQPSNDVPGVIPGHTPGVVPGEVPGQAPGQG